METPKTKWMVAGQARAATTGPALLRSPRRSENDNKAEIQYVAKAALAENFVPKFAASPARQAIWQTRSVGKENTARLLIGQMLTGLRETRGKSRAEVAARLGKNRDTVRRWESGESVPDRSNLNSLCDIYDADAQSRSTLGTLLLAQRDPMIQESSSTPDDLRVLVEAENRATSIVSIEPEYVPGLLQTRAYHRAIQTSDGIERPEAALRHHQDLRTARQERLFGRDPVPQMSFILGPAVLSHLASWSDIPARDEQLALLKTRAQHPKVDVRVIGGFSPAMLGVFTLFYQPGNHVTTYMKTYSGAQYSSNGVLVSRLTEVAAAARRVATPLEEYLHGTRKVAQIQPQR